MYEARVEKQISNYLTSAEDKAVTSMNFSFQFNTVSPSDRFIPRRSDADLEASYYLLNKKPPSPEHCSYKDSEYVDYAYLDWKQRMYQER